MMTMLEKMAKALYDADVSWQHGGCGIMLDVALPPWERASERSRRQFLLQARAALLAIREPSGFMLVKGDSAFGCGMGTIDHADDLKAVWPAMIDAILADVPQA